LVSKCLLCWRHICLSCFNSQVVILGNLLLYNIKDKNVWQKYQICRADQLYFIIWGGHFEVHQCWWTGTFNVSGLFFWTHWPFKLYEIEEIAVFLFQKSLVFVSRKSLLLLYLNHLCVW
jgi:hypothetical protein